MERLMTDSGCMLFIYLFCLGRSMVPSGDSQISESLVQCKNSEDMTNN